MYVCVCMCVCVYVCTYATRDGVVRTQLVRARVRFARVSATLRY